MTYEEAIKYLIAPVATSTEPSAEYLKQKEAYDLAIHALETGEIYITGEDYNLYVEGYKAGKRDFKPKQGEWKVYGKQGGIPITDMCSNCRYEMKWYKNKYNFCPNCGAVMRREGAV